MTCKSSSLMDRVDRHDVGVLQLGERPRFAEQLGDDLQHHEAVGQLALPGQIDAAEGAPTQLGEQAKAEELAPDPGHRRHGPGQPSRDVGVRAVQLVEDLGVLPAPLEAFPGRTAGLAAGTDLAPAPVLIGQGRFRQQGGVEPSGPSPPGPPAAVPCPAGLPPIGPVGRNGQVFTSTPKRRWYSAGVGSSPASRRKRYSSKVIAWRLSRSRKSSGNRIPVVLQGSGLAVVPVVFEIDADQLAQHRAVERVAGLGEERLQVDRFAAGPRRFKGPDEVVELHLLRISSLSAASQSSSRRSCPNFRRVSWRMRSTVRLRATHLPGDLPDLMTLDPEPHHLPGLGRQLLQDFLEDQYRNSQLGTPRHSDCEFQVSLGRFAADRSGARRAWQRDGTRPCLRILWRAMTRSSFQRSSPSGTS